MFRIAHPKRTILIFLLSNLIIGNLVKLLKEKNPNIISRIIQPPEITVYISGEVKKPGVYVLPSGSRVNDAIMAAGGIKKDADLEKINLAEYIFDETKIGVLRRRPRKEEEEEG